MGRTLRLELQSCFLSDWEAAGLLKQHQAKTNGRRETIMAQITMTHAEYLKECTDWKISAIWSTLASIELNFLPAMLLACICYYPFVCCGGPTVSSKQACIHSVLTHGNSTSGGAEPFACKCGWGRWAFRAGVSFLCLYAALAARRTWTTTDPLGMIQDMQKDRVVVMEKVYHLD